MTKNKPMLDTPVVITGLVSVLTLALSRCRCIVRSTPEGHTQWGMGFTYAELYSFDLCFVCVFGC